MAAAPPFSDLQLETVPPELRTTMDGIFRNLNEFGRGTVAGLAGGLTFAANFQCVVATFSVTVPMDWVTIPDSSLTNGWLAFSSSFVTQYRVRADGDMQLMGALKSGTINTIAIPASILGAYTPSQDVNYVVDAADAFGKLTIKGSNGAVVPAVGSNVFFQIDCRWTPANRAAYVPSCFPVLCKWGRTAPPTMAWVAAATDITSGQALSFGPVSLTWTFSAGTQNNASQLKVTNVTGLVPGRKYSLSVLALVG